MAYDLIEPLDPAGAILRGISAGPAEQPAAATSPQPNWMQQKLNMLHYFKLFGKEKRK